MNAKGNPNAEAAYIKWKHSQNDKSTVDAKFNKGDRYKNKNGAVIIIDDPDKLGNVQFKIGGDVRSSSPESLEKMLKANDYSKDSQSVFDKAIRVCDEKLYSVEYASIPGADRKISYVYANNEKEAANKVKGVVYNVKEKKTYREA